MRIVLTYRDYGECFALLRQHVLERGLGQVFVSPLDCILGDTTVVQPDVVYVESGRSSLVSARGVEGPPTLAFEVVSPSTVQVDRGTKLQPYARYGIPNHWIVDPDARGVGAYVLTGGAFRLAATLPRMNRRSLPPFAALMIDARTLWPEDNS